MHLWYAIGIVKVGKGCIFIRKRLSKRIDIKGSKRTKRNISEMQIMHINNVNIKNANTDTPTKIC